MGASTAFRAAFEATLKAGHRILSVEDGKFVRMLPDGRREFGERIDRRERMGKVSIRWRTAFPD